ncbi:hypothetical protein RvY_06371 [Ramazzottius varieornatus]|uniref:Uncharacterized protein n=1 Tax=Ramazzottius varieornatus TaxID=947166 RepID=A0A1D1V4R5_RAMVA|nr:hypothetical protein RvY_06371 [Ramazzottius varieornatus]
MRQESQRQSIKHNNYFKQSQLLQTRKGHTLQGALREGDQEVEGEVQNRQDSAGAPFEHVDSCHVRVK